MNVPGTMLLSGIVGSVAYGLNHEGSDIDRLGVFAAPTESLLRITPPPASRETVLPEPDATFHEARKYLALALAVNPTATELVWLPDELIETRTKLGDLLRGLRHSFLSSTAVKHSYLDYAEAQFRRLKSRAAGHSRIAKHARHLARLIIQGTALYKSGVLAIRLEDPQWHLDFGERVAAGDVSLCESLIARAAEAFTRPSPLPEHADREAPEAWLENVRRTYWNAAS